MKLHLSVLGVILLNALHINLAATTTAVKSRQSNVGSSSCAYEYQQAVQSYQSCINSIDTSTLPCIPSCDCCRESSRRDIVFCCEEFITASSFNECGSGPGGKKRNTSFDCKGSDGSSNNSAVSGSKSVATLWYPVIGFLALAAAIFLH